MRLRSRWWAAIGAIIASLTVFTFALRYHPPAQPDAVRIHFLGYTNASEKRFALFSVSNQAPYSLRWRGDWVEVEGYSYHQGRIMNPNLPGFRYVSILESGKCLEMAVGEPFHSDESGRWRFSMRFDRNSMAVRWFDFSSKHKLPLKIGPVLLVDSQRILDSTNHVTAQSDWLNK